MAKAHRRGRPLDPNDLARKIAEHLAANPSQDVSPRRAILLQWGSALAVLIVVAGLLYAGYAGVSRLLEAVWDRQPEVLAETISGRPTTTAAEPGSTSSTAPWFSVFGGTTTTLESTGAPYKTDGSSPGPIGPQFPPLTTTTTTPGQTTTTTPGSSTSSSAGSPTTSTPSPTTSVPTTTTSTSSSSSTTTNPTTTTTEDPGSTTTVPPTSTTTTVDPGSTTTIP